MALVQFTVKITEEQDRWLGEHLPSGLSRSAAVRLALDALMRHPPSFLRRSSPDGITLNTAEDSR